MPDFNSVRLVVAKFKSMPLDAFVLKSWRKFTSHVLVLYSSWHDVRWCSRQKEGGEITGSFIGKNRLDVTGLDLDAWEYRCSQYLNHNFDLLGSGPVNVAYNNKFIGVEGFHYSSGEFSFDDYEELIFSLLRRAHADSASLIGSLIDKDYEPIDWQVDFKSGYRWSEKTASSKIQYGNVLGADIKYLGNWLVYSTCLSWLYRHYRTRKMRSSIVEKSVIKF